MTFDEPGFIQLFQNSSEVSTDLKLNLMEPFFLTTFQHFISIDHDETKSRVIYKNAADSKEIQIYIKNYVNIVK